MTSISSVQKVSKRSLTLNKSFVLSVIFHICLIFGITFTTFYKIPLAKDSPIINVKFANSSQDMIGYESQSELESIAENQETESLTDMSPKKNTYQAYKVKKLQANSFVSNEEAMYLNLWQRNIESTGDKVISSKNIDYVDSRVQVMATIDSFGNLIKSEILISKLSIDFETNNMFSGFMSL